MISWPIAPVTVGACSRHNAASGKPESQKSRRKYLSATAPLSHVFSDLRFHLLKIPLLKVVPPQA